LGGISQYPWTIERGITVLRVVGYKNYIDRVILSDYFDYFQKTEMQSILSTLSNNECDAFYTPFHTRRKMLFTHRFFMDNHQKHTSNNENKVHSYSKVFFYLKNSKLKLHESN